MLVELARLRPDWEFFAAAPDALSPAERDASAGSVSQKLSGAASVPSNLSWALYPGRAVRFARKESGGIVNVPWGYSKVLRTVLPDVVLENPFSWITPRSYVTWLHARRHGIPVIYYDPGDDIPITAKHKVMAVWEKRIVRDATYIVTYNDAGRRRFIRKYGYAGNRIHVIPKPVDCARWHRNSGQEFRRRFGVREDEFCVGFIGRLAEYKGSRFLLDVADMAKREGLDCKFVFVGGALGSAVRESDYVRDNTVVTGMIPNDDLPEAMAALDVVVFPDITNPGGFPTTVAESMAAGKSMVVGTGVEQCFLPLRDQKDALLVAPSDPMAIYSAIRTLKNDHVLRLRIAHSVREYALQYMDYPAVAKAYHDLIIQAKSGLFGGEECPSK